MFRTSHELEGLGNVSSELLGVGHLDVGHVGGVGRSTLVKLCVCGSFGGGIRQSTRKSAV